MKRFILLGLAALAGTVLPTVACRAGTLTLNQTPGVTQVTTSLQAMAMTFGDEMAGMTVTATFANNTTETATWMTTGLRSGGATGTRFSLQFPDQGAAIDTFNGMFTLSNNDPTLGLTMLSIDAGAGDTVFDRTFGNLDGTLGSDPGRDFTTSGLGSLPNLTVTYSDQVALAGQSVVGDIFRNLKLAFDGTGLPAGEQLDFIQDTDNISFPGDIRPLAAIPEPGTLALFATAGLGLVALRRRRK